MIERDLPDDFIDVANVQAANEESLFGKPNVEAVGIGNKLVGGEDTGEQAVMALVDMKVDKALLSPDELIPPTIDGKPTDVVEAGYIQAGGPAAGTITAPEFLDLDPGPSPDGNGRDATDTKLESRRESATARDVLQQEIRDLALTRRVRPAMGGYSVGHHRITAGTIATGCYDWGDLPGVPRRYYVLSNNHVLANSNNASAGDPILQPGPVDGGSYPRDLFARLTRFVPIRFATSSSTPRNYVDAAIAEVPFHYLNREVYWIGHVRDLFAPARVGDLLQKTGRTTNFTTGRVKAINSTVNVNYGGGRVARFVGQIITGAMSAGGDSGSLVTNLDEEAVGLLFAGSSQVTIMSPIYWVQRLLGVRITEK